MKDDVKMGPKPKDYGHEYSEKSSIDVLAQDLERKLADTMYQRGSIDTRMVEDLRNYHGMYDADTLKAMKDKDSANVFIKLTRAKTNAGEAQLIDLLFPNDDKNWGINPTPKPELASLREDSEAPYKLGQQEFQDGEGNIITQGEVADRSDQLVKSASEAMSILIEDQLVETKYNNKSRSVIHDACVIGTGILKGPVVVGKLDRAYIQDKQTGDWATVNKHTFVPGCEFVRPWDFYPDMSASTIEEAEFIFERRYLSKKQIRQLKKKKGFSVGQLNKVVAMTGPQTQHNSTYMEDVRIMAGLSDTLNDTRYETWEYHGPIRRQILHELGALELDIFVDDNGEERDPTPEEVEKVEESLQDEVDAVVTYCGGIVLGAKINLMDYCRAYPYRVYNWEVDDSSIFGYGIPRMVRDEQAIINTTWRMILDNGAITSGPQIGVNKKYVQPADGNWNMKPRKFWEIDGPVRDIKEVFTTFEMNSHINELSSIYETARTLFDEVSGVPMIQQGEQGQATQTLGGMSMLMNAANTVRRAQVKNWDDDITSPMIGDFYHFNMEYSEDSAVKGDYQVDARGTSALLIKEQVGAALTNFLSIAGNSPIFAPVLQLKSVEILKEWAKTQQLPASIIPPDDELRAYQKQQEEAAKEGPQDPAIALEQMRQQGDQQKQAFDMEIEKFRAQVKQSEMQDAMSIKQAEMGASMQLAEGKMQIEVMKLAQNKEISTEKILAELQKIQSQNNLEWDKFMAEVDIKRASGTTANYGLN